MSTKTERTYEHHTINAERTRYVTTPGQVQHLLCEILDRLGMLEERLGDNVSYAVRTEVEVSELRDKLHKVAEELQNI